MGGRVGGGKEWEKTWMSKAEESGNERSVVWYWCNLHTYLEAAGVSDRHCQAMLLQSETRKPRSLPNWLRYATMCFFCKQILSLICFPCDREIIDNSFEVI